MSELTVDAFAGPGGWSEGLKSLGLRDVGVEIDPGACATRAAAGHLTIRADVEHFPLGHLAGRVWGLIASPPCPDFSTAGQGAGIGGGSGRLLSQALRWALELRPEWVTFEQVAPVLSYWHAYGDELRRHGYDVLVGVLDAANFGVPQNRKRAVLIASRVRTPNGPEPTHSAGANLFGLPEWVTLADVLKLGPGWVYDSGQNSQLGGGVIERYTRSCDRPAGTLTGKAAGQWKLTGPDGQTRKVSVVDALRLQGFRPDYPVRGPGQQQQIGNAVPPPMAARILAAAIGIEADAIGRAA